MPIQQHIKTYTLTDLKIAPLTGDVPGSLIDLPGIQSCEITIGNDSTKMRGDNADLAIIDQGNALSFKLQAGGVALNVLPILLGGTTTDTGSTPNVVRSYHLLGSNARPYFFLVGVSPSDDGSQNLHVAVWKAKATGDFAITQQDQEFLVPEISGEAVVRSDSGRLFSMVEYETAAVAAVPA